MEMKDFLDRNQIEGLSYVYIVLLTPSLIGSFSVLVVSIFRRRELREQAPLLVQLALADLLAALILMSTSVMNKVGSSHCAEICWNGLPLALTFYFISFLLVGMYAWTSKTAMQGWRQRAAGDEDEQNHSRRRMFLIHVYTIVWLVPLIMYIVYVHTFSKSDVPHMDICQNGIVGNGSTKCCCILFLRVWDESSKLADGHNTLIDVLLPVIVVAVMLSCSIIYYKVGRWYEKHIHDGLFPVEGDGHSRRRFRRVFSAAKSMVIVILVCWAPALLLILLSTVTKVTQKSLFGLYVVQAATVSLQGFLNSLVYAWRRPNFTEAVLGEKTPLVQYNHLAFFDESLKS